MLEFIRKKANSTTFKVLLGVLALTFVFCFGIFDIIRRITGKDYVVKIGKVKITPVLFEIEKTKKLNMLRAQDVKVDEKAEINHILHQIIWENVVEQAASEYGFILSEDTIKKYIAGMAIFRDKDGRFNAGRLRAFLSNINVSEAMFIDFSGRDIKNALVKAPFKYVSAQKGLDCFIRSNLEKRTLAFTEIDPKSINIVENPTEADLENFYSENPDLFTLEESRDFSLVELLEDDIAKTVKVTEEEIREIFDSTPAQEDDRPYDERKGEIRDELMQDRLQVAIDDVTRQIEDALMSGENFEEVIKKFGLSVKQMKKVTALDKGGKSDSAVKSKYRDDILTVAFSTEEGSDSSFSEAVNENEKRVLWLVHVDSITPKHVAPFDTIKEKVSKEWNKNQQKEKALEIARNMCDSIKKGEKIATLAAKSGKRVIVTKAFDRFGNWPQPKKEEENAENSEKGKQKVAKKSLQKDPNEDKMRLVAQMFAEDAFAANKGAAFFKEAESGKVIVAQLDNVIPLADIEDKVRNAGHVELVRAMSDDLYQQLVNYLSKVKYEIKINHEMLEKSGADTSDLDGIF